MSLYYTNNATHPSEEYVQAVYINRLKKHFYFSSQLHPLSSGHSNSQLISLEHWSYCGLLGMEDNIIHHVLSVMHVPTTYSLLHK